MLGCKSRGGVDHVGNAIFGGDMRNTIISLSALIGAFGISTADAQEPLPHNVAELYVAYQQAEQSGDLAMIVEAADAVYRAGRDARIGDETLATLAENLGFYAAAAGDHERAYDAWRYAAERTERFEGAGVTSGYRWQNAALAAFAGGDESDARRCAMNASNGFGAHGLSEPEVSGAALEAHLLAAQLNGSDSRFSDAGAAAERALAIMEAEGRGPDRFYAIALFHAGVENFRDERFELAAVRLHIAADLFEYTAGHADEIERSNTLARFAGFNAVRELGSRYGSDHFEVEARAFTERRDRQIEAYAFHAEIAGSLDSPPVQRDLPEGATPYEITFRQDPTYPYDAARRSREGWTAFRFTINERGRLEDIELLGNVGDRSFIQASIDALEGWIYEPAMLDGEPIRVEGVETQFNFTMSN